MKSFKSFLIIAIISVLTVFAFGSYGLPAIGQAPETVEEATEATLEKTPRLTESERVRRKLLIQGDAAHRAGDFAEAQALYRQAKDETWLVPYAAMAQPLLWRIALPPEPFTDESLLSPAGSVYLREARAGIADERLSQTLVVALPTYKIW